MGATVRDVSTPQDFTTLAQQQNVNTGFNVDKGGLYAGLRLKVEPKLQLWQNSYFERTISTLFEPKHVPRLIYL